MSTPTQIGPTFNYRSRRGTLTLAQFSSTLIPASQGRVMPAAFTDVTIGQVALALGIIAAFIGGVRKVWPWLSRLKDFFDDLMGEPERPGVNARPGVMARLSASETATVKAAGELEKVRLLAASADYNSKANGGHSAHDKMTAQIERVSTEVASMRSDVAKVGERLDVHIEQAASVHEEQAAAITFAIEGRAALDDMAEALPIIARSTPHECDVPTDAPPEGEET